MILFINKPFTKALHDKLHKYRTYVWHHFTMSRVLEFCENSGNNLNWKTSCSSMFHMRVELTRSSCTNISRATKRNTRASAFTARNFFSSCSSIRFKSTQSIMRFSISWRPFNFGRPAENVNSVHCSESRNWRESSHLLISLCVIVVHHGYFSFTSIKCTSYPRLLHISIWIARFTNIIVDRSLRIDILLCCLTDLHGTAWHLL